MMILKRDTEALCDKVRIYNFYISEIFDIPKLQEIGIVNIIKGRKIYIPVNKEDEISSVCIKENEYFDNLIYAVGIDGHVFSEMELSVPDDEKYHNLNCMRLEEYQLRLEEIKDFLLKEYGIVIRFEDSKFKTMEINKTIILNDEFLKYQRPIKTIMYLFPKKLRLKEHDYFSEDQNTEKNFKRSIETFMKDSGKQGITIKFYDKKKQLESKYKIYLPFECLRFEITLKKPSKIRKNLGTNKVFELTDEKLNLYFRKFIDENIRKPMELYQKQMKSNLRRILKKYYSPSSHTWSRDILLQISGQELEKGVPLMFDISNLLNEIDVLKLGSKQKKYSVKQRFICICREELQIYMQEDGKRCYELLTKL